eukprot:7309691-Heterocapsa_arctica.AAC.1
MFNVCTTPLAETVQPCRIRLVRRALVHDVADVLCSGVVRVEHHERVVVATRLVAFHDTECLAP